MSVLVTYFAAPDDTTAAATVDRGDVAGLDAPGIEPFIALGMFEQFLTGQTWEAQQTDPASRVVGAERDGGERLVVRIDPRLVAATAAAGDARLQDVVGSWSRIEEFEHWVDDAPLHAFAPAFRGLCADARARGHGVYCRQVA